MVAQLLGKPIWEQMHKGLVTSSVFHVEETVIHILNELDRTHLRYLICDGFDGYNKLKKVARLNVEFM